MQNPFISFATHIYAKRKKCLSKDQGILIKKKLQQLYPLEDVEKKYEKYCIKRMAAVFTVIFIGIVSVICSLLCSRNGNRLTEGALLMRNEKGAGNYAVTLIAEVEDWTEEIPITVKERQLTNQEKIAFISNMPFRLSELIEFPPQTSPQEQFYNLLREKLSLVEEEGNDQKEIFLPQNVEGRNVLWKEKESKEYLWIILLIFAGGFLVCWAMDKEIEKEHKKRSKQLLMAYPGCVNKLRLYLSAGLTVRNTFFRMVEDYQKQKFGKRQYIYEEMQVACHQLRNGIMEEQVYEDWGKRCSEMRIKRLSYLLAVHVKKGNAQLLELLAREAESAQEDRRGQARKLGEEAGTKLLLPMMLMLLIVMFIILLPAWAGVGAM